MASSTDGYKDTKDAKDFQEWIEINKSRHHHHNHTHETLIDQLSTSSLSSSSSHELINQCGKGLNGVGVKGKKVRFKKKLRRIKDHNLNYRSGYYRGDDRRNGRPSQLCHLFKLFSTFGGFITLVALIFVVVNVQTHLELLQIQLRTLNDHYHGMATTLTALKKKTQDHDSIIFTLTANLSACLNNDNNYNTKPETYGDINTSTSPLTTTKFINNPMAEINWLPKHLKDLSFQVNRLGLNITHCNEKMSTLEGKLNATTQMSDGLSKSFSFVNNKLTENSGKLEHLMGLVGHLVELTSNLNATSTTITTH